MTTFFAILLTLLTFAFVAYPLLRQRFNLSAETAEDEEVQELKSRRDTTYSMLKELEFDYQSGILSKDDYQELENRYKRRAVSVLKDIDERKKVPSVEDEIEKEIKKKKGAGLEDEIEKAIRQRRQSKGRFCTKCGTKAGEGDRFCSKCGAGLARGGKGD